MPGRQDVNSAASTRPQPKNANKPTNTSAARNPSNSVNRNYSGGVQNGVTTTNIDDEDPESTTQDATDDEETTTTESNILDFMSALKARAGLKK